MAPSMSVTRSVAIVGGLARQALFRRPSFRSTPWPADSSLASSGPRFILTCPLGVRQAPPTTERLVELHVGEETVAANLRERVLRRVELLLGFEHFEIIGQPLAIAIGRMLYGLREGLHRRVLSRLGLVQLAQRGEDIRDFAERAEDRLLVLEPRLLPLRDGRAIGPQVAARVEERSAEHARHRPDRRRPSREGRHLGTGRTEQSGQAQLGEELRLGDADPRIGAHELLLGLAEVGAPLEERRRQSGRRSEEHTSELQSLAYLVCRL